jgi:hypothetical protein
MALSPAVEKEYGGRGGLRTHANTQKILDLFMPIGI